MYKITLLMLSVFLYGCSHVSVTKEELLNSYQYANQSNPDSLEKISMSIDATMDCYKRRTGLGTIEKSCSNKNRIVKTAKIFEANGMLPVFVKTPKDGVATLSIKKEPINGFFERLTGFFNIITLGLSPLYHYDDYVVVYEDPKKNILIKKEARVSSYTSWFSLFMSNPQDLSSSEIKSRTELNLIDSVAREIKEK